MIELLLQAERALSMGMVDQAERLYRQAVDADPLNSIAVVGLARVALERADDDEAWRQAKRALEIDPENAAALRLVERLEEIWRFNGRLPPDQVAAAGTDAAGVTTDAAPGAGVEHGAAPGGAPEPDAAPEAQPDPAPAPGSKPGLDAAPEAGAAPGAAPEPARSALSHDTAVDADAAPDESAAPSTPRRGIVDRLLGRNRP